MKSQPMVQYRYALDSARSVVDVEDLSSDPEARKSPYWCVSCGQSLIPVLGDQRRKHFRHQVEVDCSRETYLHMLGKQMFYQVYRNCLETGQPFEVEFLETRTCIHCRQELGLPCTLPSELKRYNLAAYFPNVQLEQQTDEFVPDLLLSNERGETLFIEIAVTHASSKSKRSSGNRIVELQIADEEDLSLIRTRLLSQNSQQVELINFRTFHESDFSQGCNRKRPIFFLLNDGWAFIDTRSVLGFLESRSSDPHLAYSAILASDSLGTYIAAMRDAVRRGFQVKNCFLCAYQRYNFRQETDGLPIYCKISGKRHRSDQALKCQHYRP